LLINVDASEMSAKELIRDSFLSASVWPGVADARPRLGRRPVEGRLFRTQSVPLHVPLEKAGAARLVGLHRRVDSRGQRQRGAS
jgi:hypothetical protein